MSKFPSCFYITFLLTFSFFSVISRHETNLGVNTYIISTTPAMHTNQLTVQVLVPLCLGLCDTISVSLLVLVVAIRISCAHTLPSPLLYLLGVVL